MTLEPLPIGTDEQMDAAASLAEALGGEAEMVRLLRRCPVCKELILVCDNGWLDAKPGGAAAMFGVMKIGPLHLMASPADEEGVGSHHRVHDHQPEEE